MGRFADDDKIVVIKVPLKVRPGKMMGFEPDLSGPELNSLTENSLQTEYEYDYSTQTKSGTCLIYMRIKNPENVDLTPAEKIAVKEGEDSLMAKVDGTKLVIKDDKDLSPELLAKSKTKEAHFANLKVLEETPLPRLGEIPKEIPK